MSLDPRDLDRRGRSRSPGGCERSRSRHKDDRERSRSRSQRRVERNERAFSPPSQYVDDRGRYDSQHTDPRHTTAALQYRSKSPRSGEYGGGYVKEEDGRGRYAAGGREKDYHVDGYGRASSYGEGYGGYSGQDRRELDRGASFNVATGHHSLSGGVNVGQDVYSAPYPTDRHYSYPSDPQYAQPADKVKYDQYGRPTSPSRHSSYDNSARSSRSQVVTVESARHHHHRRDASPNPTTSLAPRMHSLSVSRVHHGSAAMALANAPGSPLLEAYHGTYQSISPMPSPLPAAAAPDVIDALSPLSSDDERRGGGVGGHKRRKSARFHDPEEEARMIATALRGERTPDTDPLIEILPGLTHEQILELRSQYKLIVKTGHERKGVNIAKHIKLRLKDEDPSLMKACYACALGKWESEAYWANFWYQGEDSRRELLIESLIGRTNREIREIKEGFRDKKYRDSLVKCMKTELKEDKFKNAVLLVLEERKMEEKTTRYGGGGGKVEIDEELVNDDVRDLHKAVRSERGGESAMIGIVVVRGDNHLREVLRVYERKYETKFAREMLKRSENLVGELLAHILNGVINKPVRDALLIHHALSLSKSDSLRTELLISRLVRYHWDRPHMEAIKREYRNRYGVEMQSAVKEGTKGEWGRFCENLCLRRMGDEIREVEGRRVDG